MPIPSPKKQEKQPTFVSRCMGDETMLKEYPDQKQRAAICYSQYRKAKTQKQAQGSSEEPEWEDNSIDGAVILV